MSYLPENQTPRIDFSKVVDTSEIEGLNVLITGGANGLGEAITRALVSHGAYVTIADQNEERGSKLADEPSLKQNCQFIHTDVTSWPSQINAFKAAITSSPNKILDLVIPCAGLPGLPLPLPHTASLDEEPPAPSTITIDVTLTGVYYTVLLALHYFRLPFQPTHNPDASTRTSAPSKKQLLFIGSLAGYLEVPPIADYNAAKFGVRGLWKSIRRQVAEENVRTNLIAPTFMPTQAINSVEARLVERGARIGKVQDVVGAVVRCAAGGEIDGRAVAVGADGPFDLRDDTEGYDGGIELLKYYKSGAMADGMHAFKEVMQGR